MAKKILIALTCAIKFVFIISVISLSLYFSNLAKGNIKPALFISISILSICVKHFSRGVNFDRINTVFAECQLSR